MPFMPCCAVLFLLQRKRQAVEAVYEARALPEDHKIPGMEQGAGWSNLGQ